MTLHNDSPSPGTRLGSRTTTRLQGAGSMAWGAWRAGVSSPIPDCRCVIVPVCHPRSPILSPFPGGGLPPTNLHVSAGEDNPMLGGMAAAHHMRLEKFLPLTWVLGPLATCGAVCPGTRASLISLFYTPHSLEEECLAPPFGHTSRTTIDSLSSPPLLPFKLRGEEGAYLHDIARRF